MCRPIDIFLNVPAPLAMLIAPSHGTDYLEIRVLRRDFFGALYKGISLKYSRIRAEAKANK